MEDVTDGTGLLEFVQGLNHVTRFLTPTVIMQWMQFFQAVSAPAGLPYLSTSEQGTDTVMTRRLMYRIPIIRSLGSVAGAAVDRLQFRVWAEALTATAGTLRIISGDGGSPFDTAITQNGDWTEYSVSVPYQSVGTFEEIEVHTAAGLAGDDIAVKSLTAWIEPGHSTLPAITEHGMDTAAWQDDQPLATHLHRTAAEKLETLLRKRVGVVCNYSDDYENLGRGDGSFTGTATETEGLFMRQMQAKLGPFTRELRVHINGYYVGGVAGEVKVSTQSNDAGHTFTMPTKAAFDVDPTATWQTAVVSMTNTEPLEPTTDLVSVLIKSPNTIQTVIASICIWEEPS